MSDTDDKVLDTITLTLTGSGEWSDGRVLAKNGSVFNVGALATFTVSTDNPWSADGTPPGAINNEGTFTLTSGNTQTIEADFSVSNGGTLEVQGGELQLTVGLTLSSGSVQGTGAIIVAGLFTWTGGDLSGGGSLTANGGVAINLMDSQAIDDYTFNLASAGTWNGLGRITLCVRARSSP